MKGSLEKRTEDGKNLPADKQEQEPKPTSLHTEDPRAHLEETEGSLEKTSASIARSQEELSTLRTSLDLSPLPASEFPGIAQDQKRAEHLMALVTDLKTSSEHRESEPVIAYQLHDRRKNPDPAETKELLHRLNSEGYEVRLRRLQERLGPYTLKTESVVLETTDALSTKAGSGEAELGLARIRLVSETNGINGVKEALRERFPDLSEEQAKELFYAKTVSTAFHESVHSILETRPGTAFHTLTETLNGQPDPEAAFSTLCDEGIAMGIQGLYAKEVPGFGRPGQPRISSEDPLYTQRGKALGERLRPFLKSLLEDEYSIQAETFIEQLVRTAKKVIEEFPPKSETPQQIRMS